MKKRVIVLICFVVVALSACFPTEKRSLETVDNVESNKSDNAAEPTKEEIPATVNTDLGENIVINANVFADKVDGLKDFSAELKKFDILKIADLVLKQEGYDSSEIEAGDKKGAEIGAQDIFGNSGSFLTVADGSVLYQSKKYQERLYNYLIFGTKPYITVSELDGIYKKDSLEGVDLPDQIVKTEQTLAEIGLQELGDPEVVALDYETLAEQVQQFNINYEEAQAVPFEKGDEGYLLIYRVPYDGLVITDKGYMSAADGMSVIGSRIYAFVSQEGLMFLKCEGIYEVNAVNKEIPSGQDFSQILKHVENEYKDIILDNPFEITNVELAYVPYKNDLETGVYEFAPFWVFSAKQSMSENGAETGFVQYFEIFSSYETGEILEIGGTE